MSGKLARQPTRKRILSRLARGGCTFVQLREELGLTDGNLYSHMRRLVQGGLVGWSKNGRTTWYVLKEQEQDLSKEREA